MTNVLGIHIGHDSSVALVRDGRIVADAAEERFTRVKHYCGLPIHALDYCLKSCDLSMADIDVVAIPTAASLPDLNFLLGLKGSRREPVSTRRFVLDTVRTILGRQQRRPPLYFKRFPLADRTEIIHVEHHLAHAAAAYYTSGRREKQLVVTMDGAGDGYSVCIWRGENGKITPLEKFPTSGSLGWFYSNVTEALGWWHGDGEGKTMGLAPYGDVTKAKGVLERFYPKFSDGRLVKPHQFRGASYWNENGAIQWHFDDADEIQRLIDRYGRESMAAEAQRILEEQTKEIVFPWMQKEKTANLSCAGGVFLNVKLNQRLWESGKITHHHIYPNAGDSGLAVGAALYAYDQLHPDSPFHGIEDLYWGPSYSDTKLKGFSAYGICLTGVLRILRNSLPTSLRMAKSLGGFKVEWKVDRAH